MLYISRPLLAWMARKWPIHEGEAEVLGELDQYLATGQLPTDARRLDVGAAGPGGRGGAGQGLGGEGQAASPGSGQPAGIVLFIYLPQWVTHK